MKLRDLVLNARHLGLGVVLLLLIATVMFIPSGGSAEPTIATPVPSVNADATFDAIFRQPGIFPSTATPFPPGGPPAPPTLTPVPRTVVPGADRGGLFADGIENLPKVDTTGWNSYANSKYGYSFRYPRDWRLDEKDNSAVSGPQGQPAYPLQYVTVQNPLADQGENVPGQNCQGDECAGTRPSFLGFFVSIDKAGCTAPGEIVASGEVTMLGKVGSRCVIKRPSARVASIVSFVFPIADTKDSIIISLQRGRTIAPQQQALLETILSTVSITR